MLTTQKYQPDESLTWTRIENEVPTKRLVRFEQYNGGSAIVTFGHSAEAVAQRHTVPLDQLSRPQAAVGAPSWYRRIEPPKPPEPLTETEVTERILTRREALADAHNRARQATAAVQSAATLAQRAAREHDEATAALATLTRYDQAAQHDLETAIRAGTASPDPHQNGVDRGYIESRVRMTEQVLTKLNTESAEAHSVLNEALATVKKAALQVVAAMIDRDVAQLAELENYALRFRSDLLAVSQHWFSANDGPIPLATSSAALLATPPDYDRARLMLDRDGATAPFQQMLDRLVQGEVYADFRLEK